MKNTFNTLILMLLCGCGVYTFNGSTLPSYIKTIDVPLFKNASLEPSIADEVTSEVNKRMMSENILRVISDRGDATLYGEVSKYVNEPYTFGTTEVRKVNVDQYIVRVTADVDFVDNKKDKSLFKGSVFGEGVYSFASESEKVGREKAVVDLVRKILEKSVQSW
jgi:Lipopolysaccharide-assembly